MIFEVRLRPEAEQDLSDAAFWYEGQRPRLGKQFLDEVLAIFSTIAETPMIDGNQEAYFNEQGAMISGKGRFQYKTKVPGGLYMDFRFSHKDRKYHGGPQVSNLIVEYRFDGDGSDAKQFVFVHEIKLVNEEFGYASKDEKSGEIVPGKASISAVRVVDGHLQFVVTGLPDATASVAFVAALVQPLEGSLRVHG